MTVFAKAPSWLSSECVSVKVCWKQFDLQGGKNCSSFVSFYWFAIHAGHSPVTRANVSTNNSILSACAVFRMQSVLQPHLIILNSSGGTTCLIILIGVIPCLVSCQPHIKGSSTLSHLHPCIWWSRSKSFNFDWMLCLSWYFLIIFMYLKLIKRFFPVAT